MTNTTATTYVPRVDIYFADRIMRTSVPVAEALELAPSAVVILGAMRPGYLGREVVTADDLHRWAAEDDAAAEWAAIAAGEGK